MQKKMAMAARKASLTLAFLCAVMCFHLLAVPPACASRIPGLIRQTITGPNAFELPVLESELRESTEVELDHLLYDHLEDEPFLDHHHAHKSKNNDEEYEEEEEEERRQHRHGQHKYDEGDTRSFLLGKPIKVMGTEAGEMRVLPRNAKHELAKEGIRLGFLILEPRALLLPQYFDGSCLFLVHTGKARLSWVEKGGLQETDMEVGDVFKLEGGTVFYILNPDEGQRLQIFSLFNIGPAVDEEMLHSFFVAGGENPKSILTGFKEDALATAFKVPPSELQDLLRSQTRGPIVYSIDYGAESREVASRWSFIKGVYEYLNLPGIFPKDTKKKPFNVLKKKPDFSNDYGSTVAVNGDDYSMLKDVNRGVFSVKLKAGAILAPHWNPKATEVALVTRGEGEIQIAFPNGTSAREQVQEGTVFFIPQYYPMSQIASRSGPLEFMGFTTSAEPSHPQFLAGSNSVLKAVGNDVLATAFDLPIDRVQEFIDAQPDAVVLSGQILKLGDGGGQRRGGGQ